VSRICILSPHPDYPENWSKDQQALTAALPGEVTYRPWTDAGDLSGFDLILPLLAWGYPREPVRWFRALDGWEATGLPFANPITLLRWNTDKDYLFDLEAAGLATVPTLESHSLCSDDLSEARARFGVDTLVIKPSISGGAEGTFRLSAGDAIPFAVLEKEMLIQPLMPSILTEGEYSLFLFDGIFSHAILKRPASGDFRVQEQFGGGEIPIDPPRDASAFAHETLSMLPAIPLYARVDILRDGKGAFRLMELEVIEPSLFLGHAPGGGAGFKAAVAARMASPRART
jgi:hypothetical protein